MKIRLFFSALFAFFYGASVACAMSNRYATKTWRTVEGPAILFLVLASVVGLLTPGLLTAQSLNAPWVTGFYSAQNERQPVSSIPWTKYTHIIHFAAAPGVGQNGHGNGTVALQWLSQSEINEIVSARPRGKKLLVCIMDNANYPNAFAENTAPGMISTFVNSIASFVYANGYDGADIDWEAGIDTTQYIQFLTELRAVLPTKVVTTDVGRGSNLEAAVSASQSHLDQINIMCYDMDWPGKGFSWYNAALFQSGNTGVMTCDWNIATFIEAGVVPAKIGIGIPFYARRWPGVTKALENGTFSPSTLLYNQLASDKTRWQPQYQFYDSVRKANYLSIHSLNEFDSYTGPQQIKDTVNWVKTEGFGGVMAFALDYEYLSSQSGDAQYPLSTALYNAMSAPPTSGPPIGNISPNSGAGYTTTFTFQVATAGGYSSVLEGDIIIGSAVGTPNSCYLDYWVPSNTLALRSDNNTTWTSAALGSSTTLQNSQCAVAVGSASVSGSGNILTLKLPVTFKAAYSGTKTIFTGAVTKDGRTSGWQTSGNWNVALAPPTATVSPNSGSGFTTTFTFQVMETSGYSSVLEGDMIIGSAVGTPNSCYLDYWVPSNTLALRSDNNTTWTSAALGSSITLQNSQCAVAVGSASVSGFGNMLTLQLSVTFKAAYSGTKTIFTGAVTKDGRTSGWQTSGNWNIP